MIEALIAGGCRPKVLAELAKGRARALSACWPRRQTAVSPTTTPGWPRLLLDQVDDLTACIDSVTTGQLAHQPSVPPLASAPLSPEATPGAVEQICAIPGAGPDNARAVIGEIGLDMAVFGTAGRLCAWAKVSPRTVQSGRKKGRGATGKGNPYLKAALRQMAAGAARTDTFLGQRYRRLAKRMPKARALAAVQRSILVIIFHLLADPAATFEDLGADYYDKRVDKAGRTRSLVHQLEAPGPPSHPQRCRLSPPRLIGTRSRLAPRGDHPAPDTVRGQHPERGFAPHPA
jgi:hypothetical protein